MKKIGVQRLHKQVVAAARADDLAADRAKRWVAATALFQLLNDAAAGGSLSYYVDGGFSVEMRLHKQARASEDIDLVLFGDGAPVNLLIQAISDSWGDFTFSRKDTQDRDRATRVVLQAHFNGVVWGTLKIDVLKEEFVPPPAQVAVEGVSPPDISRFGLPNPGLVRCASRAAQIADYIHAITKPEEGGTRRDRSRNLIDLYLFDSLCPCADDEALRATVAAFERDPSHAFPPRAFVMPPQWIPGLAERIADLGLHIAPEGLEEFFLSYIARISGVRVRVNFEYRFVVLTVPTQVPTSFEGVFVRDPAYEAMERMTGQEGFRLAQMVSYPWQQPTRALIAILEREKQATQGA